MTIKRARELLGLEIVNLTAEEIQQMIDRDFNFCDALLDIIMSVPEKMLTNYEKQN